MASVSAFPKSCACRASCPSFGLGFGAGFGALGGFWVLLIGISCFGFLTSTGRHKGVHLTLCRSACPASRRPTTRKQSGTHIGRPDFHLRCPTKRCQSFNAVQGHPV